MAELDALAVKQFGIDGQVLMESAGRAVVDVIEKRYPEVRRIIVLCGPGNNGGDGFVIARTWSNRGKQADVRILGEAKAYQGDAAINLRRLKLAGVEFSRLDEGEIFWRGYDLVVDALFGTGLSRPLESRIGELLEGVRESGVPVLAVDIPSGIDAATGGVLGAVLPARDTVTFGLPRLGHYFYPGASLRGRLHVCEIGFPRRLLEDSSRGGELVDRRFVRTWLPRRSPTSHKGSAGRALLWVGSERYPGAAALCARGALRGGAGLVHVAAPQRVCDLVLQQTPEAIVLPLLNHAPDEGWLESQRALCVGPGLGIGRLDQISELLNRPSLPPTVIDADALRALPARLSNRTVLTPHHGELARLLGITVENLERDRLKAVRDASRQLGCVVVLKGAPTLIAEPEGRYYVNRGAHSVLAQGGTGDVLAGLITALLAQGMSTLPAAVVGVWIHGRAAQRAARRLGPRGVGAQRIADEIPAVFAALEAQGNRKRGRN